MAEISIPTFEQLSTIMSHLLTNYTELIRVYWDMFYSTEPQTLTLKVYDEDGNLVNVEIPNRAKDFNFVQNGEGSPEGAISAAVGTTYQDTLNGKLYIKELGNGNTGWKLIGSDESIRKGNSNPEGLIIGAKGDIYEDKTSCSIYIKTTERGNEGWVLINANTENLADRDLSNLSNIGQSKLNAKEDKANKIQTITAQRTDKYPSEKSVSTYVDSNVSNLANKDLSNLSTEGENYLNDRYANKYLSNLSDSGQDRLHALKSYVDEGKVLEDSEGLADVTSYAYSTFDESKFTKIGSPEVTAEGNATNFSESNALSTTNFNISLLLNKSWSIMSAAVTGITSSMYGDYFICISPWEFSSDGAATFSGTNRTISFLINTPSDTDSETRANNRITIIKELSTLPEKIQLRLDFDYTTGKYSGYYNIFDGSGWQLAGSTTPATTEKQLYDIVYNNNHAININRREQTGANTTLADLKYFEVRVDGYPYFLGPKTGIDIIKTNDYTKVGHNEIVNNEGIASGFTTDNYLYSEFYFDISETGIFEVELGDLYSIGLDREQYIIQIYRSDVAQKEDEIILRRGSLISEPEADPVYSHEWALRIFNGPQTTTPDQSHVVFNKSVNETINKISTLKFGYNGSNYYMQADGTITTGSSTNEKLHPGTYNIYIGVRYEPGGITAPLVSGSLDLSRVKVSVDGVSIYQPCLRVPYIVSKTGSMIVDSAYRERISSVYEELGSAPYYSLDKINNNFTLPQGEIYGLSRISNQITTLAPAIKAYGVTLVGSEIENANGIVSGFAAKNDADLAGNYAAPIVEFTTENGDWEINLKITTGQDVSGYQAILAGYPAECGSAEIWLINGTLRLFLSSNGSGSGDIVAYPDSTLGENVTEPDPPENPYKFKTGTTYWIKAKFDKAAHTYSLSHSLAGRIYTLDREYDTTREVLPFCFLRFGLDHTSDSGIFKGSIDLKSCNFIANNTIMWQGTLLKDNVYVTPQKSAVVVETYSCGNSWYRVWSDGWCEQGGVAPVGYVTGTSDEKLITVSLLKSYTNSNYSVVGTPQADGIESNRIYYDISVLPYRKNVQEIEFAISPTSSLTFYIPYIYWETRGYIK